MIIPLVVLSSSSEFDQFLQTLVEFRQSKSYIIGFYEGKKIDSHISNIYLSIISITINLQNLTTAYMVSIHNSQSNINEIWFDWPLTSITKKKEPRILVWNITSEFWKSSLFLETYVRKRSRRERDKEKRSEEREDRKEEDGARSINCISIR